MSKIQELKEKIEKLEKAIKSPATPNEMKEGFKETKTKLEGMLADEEAKEKEKEEKKEEPKPKKVKAAKPKKEGAEKKSKTKILGGVAKMDISKDKNVVVYKGKSYTLDECDDLFKAWNMKKKAAAKSSEKSVQRPITEKVLDKAETTIKQVLSDKTAKKKIEENPKQAKRELAKVEKTMRSFLDAVEEFLGKKIPDSKVNKIFSFFKDIDLMENGGALSYADVYDGRSAEFANGGSIISEISKYKKQLISKAKSKGLYENFGKAEVRKLEDKYGYTNEVRDFDNWAMNFDLSDLKEYANGGSIISEISKYKKQLISKAKSKGLYENFGKAEVRKLEDKYGYTNEVRDFDNWAMNFDLSDLKEYAKGGKISIKDIEWSNDDNKQLGIWLLTSVDGNSILSKSKNANELEKNVMEYYKKKGSIAKMIWDEDEDEGLSWVTFSDLYNEIKMKYANGGSMSERGSWSIEIEEDENDEDTRNKEVARLIRKGYSSGYSPTWTLKTTINIEGNEEYIANMVEQGYTQGELIKEYANGGSMSGDAPRIYVADLAAYNNGQLVGEWLDLSDYDSGEEVMDAITELLEKWSEESGEEREEFAIHDYENFDSSLYSEYMGEDDFDMVVKSYKLAKDRGVPTSVISYIMREYQPDDIEDWFDDRYEGQFDSDEDLAYHYVDMIGGLENVGQDTLERYFDYESFGRDLAYDYTEVDGYYFRTYKKGGSIKKYDLNKYMKKK